MAKRKSPKAAPLTPEAQQVAVREALTQALGLSDGHSGEDVFGNVDEYEGTSVSDAHLNVSFTRASRELDSNGQWVGILDGLGIQADGFLSLHQRDDEDGFSCDCVVGQLNGDHSWLIFAHFSAGGYSDDDYDGSLTVDVYFDNALSLCERMAHLVRSHAEASLKSLNATLEAWYETADAHDLDATAIDARLSLAMVPMKGINRLGASQFKTHLTEDLPEAPKAKGPRL
jgi:hypothetical protein